MANARKCNRCGKCFDPLNVAGMIGRFENPIFQSSADVREQKVSKRLIEGEAPDVYVDLCPECAEMFEVFMSGCDLPEDFEKKYLNEKDRHEKASEKMFEALKRARVAEEENETLKKTMKYWDKQMENEQIRCNEWHEKSDLLEQRCASYERAFEKLKKERDDAFEEVCDLRDENDLLMACMENDVEAIVKKAKQSIFDAVQEMDAEDLKYRIVTGLSRVLYPKIAKDVDDAMKDLKIPVNFIYDHKKEANE